MIKRHLAIALSAILTTMTFAAIATAGSSLLDPKRSKERNVTVNRLFRSREC